MQPRSRRSHNAGSPAVIGIMAGITATVAMTMAMDAMFKRLPPGERYPLPPRELTERMAAMAQLPQKADEQALRTATLLSHFGFGAATGMLYACAAKRRAGIGSGIAFGLAVWTVSYLGWVPGLNLLRPAWQHPAKRNVLMIIAHVVWGSVLGFVVQRLSGAGRPFRAGPPADAPHRFNRRR